MADQHQHIAGAPVPTTLPTAPIERPHIPDEASEEGWKDSAPPDPEPHSSVPPPAPAPPHMDTASLPNVAQAGTPAALVATTLTSTTAPWWGGGALRWLAHGGGYTLALAAGLYLASPAGLSLLGHAPMDADRIAKDLRPVFAQELQEARAQWVADAKREQDLRDREREAKDRALQESIDRLSEEQRYQRGILEGLRDRRR